VKKFIIGISAFYHDSSVCLFKDGELVFACEEEKFTGIKHDSSFPVNALNYIFKRYRIKKSDVESVCYYEDPLLKLERVKSNIKPLWFKKPLYSFKSYLNIKDKTMVLTPQDAIDTFYDTDLDVLVIDNIIIEKNRNNV
jgi:predicted NodU family carbamoyl transferase